MPKTYATRQNAIAAARKLTAAFDQERASVLTFLVTAEPDGRFALVFFVDQHTYRAAPTDVLMPVVHAGHRAMLGFIPADWLGAETLAA